jgi:N-acetylglucosamine kinase-like BadF-type ATPase
MNLKGEVVSIGRAGPSNPITIGVEGAVSNILEAVDLAKKGADVSEFKSSVLGLAGIARSYLRDEIASRLPDSYGETMLVSDARSALAGATGCKPGVVVIAGTGSIAYGMNEAGSEARAGGWGWRLGDEGSGYTIGKNAVIAALRAFDESGPSTVLLEWVLDKLGFSDADDVIDWAYSKGRQPRHFAEFVPLVKKAEREGDRVAAEIMFDAGIELGRVTQAVIKRLNLRGEFPVACCGGVFLQPNRYNVSFEKTVRQVAKGCEFIEPLFSPTVGSGLLALESVGVVIGEAVITGVDESLRCLDD